jgi:hypothetical protein
MRRWPPSRDAWEGAVTPLLDQTSAVVRLARREREVALLAARHGGGTKLGISRRAQLALLFADLGLGRPNGRQRRGPPNRSIGLSRYRGGDGKTIQVGHAHRDGRLIKPPAGQAVRVAGGAICPAGAAFAVKISERLQLILLPESARPKSRPTLR